MLAIPLQMPIALGLLLVLAEMTSPVQGQTWSEDPAAWKKVYARKRFEATQAGLKDLGEARLESARERVVAASLGWLQGRQDHPLGSLLAGGQAWQEAAQTHLGPGPARDRELAQIAAWLWRVEQAAGKKWNDGSLSDADLHAIRWQRSLFEYNLRKNRPQAGLPSAAAGPRWQTLFEDYFLSEPTSAFHRRQARARFETSQADLTQLEQQLLETARSGFRATMWYFLQGRQDAPAEVVVSWSQCVRQAEQLAMGKPHARREFLEREWLEWLGLERLSQAKFDAASLSTGDLFSVRLLRLRAQIAMALAGEVRPVSQRRSPLAFVPDLEVTLKDSRAFLQDSFAGTVTPIAILRQQQLQVAEVTFRAGLRSFLDGRQDTPWNLVAARALLPLQASLEGHDEKSASLLLALRWFEIALAQEDLARAMFQAGSLRLASMLEARVTRLSAAIRLLQVSQAGPKR